MTTVWTGLSVGGIYALVALGYNIVYLASGALNFANASLIMIGAFLIHWLRDEQGLPWALVVVVSGLVVMVIAVLQERVSVRPVQSLDGLLVTTVGAATIMAGTVQLLSGSNPLPVAFLGRTSPVHIFGGAILLDEVSLIVVAVVATGLTALVSRRTMAGLALLAVAENQEATTLRGVDAKRLRLVAFAVSGALAGMAACVVAPQTLAYPDLGSTLALKGFVALAVGGFGSIGGGLVGGFAVGLIEAVVASRLSSSYSDVFVLAALLLVLVARPTGLAGRLRERVI